MPTTEEKRAYQRAHYHANKEMWRKKRQRYEASMRAIILAAKDRSCADCGGRWPAIVMEFDHRPGTVKKFNLGDQHARKHGIEAVKEEIAKCDVLCPTCHRVRTFRRQGKLPDIAECCCSSMVERFLGKDEVSGSSPDSSFLASDFLLF
jgi:5-methylcytosine-specific restriction endonuclease McrA